MKAVMIRVCTVCSVEESSGLLKRFRRKFQGVSAGKVVRRWKNR